MSAGQLATWRVHSAPPRRGQRLRSEAGAASVEWTLVAALLTVLFLAVLQVAFTLHIRTVLIDAAAEGARAAGLRGADVNDGRERTRVLIETAVSPAYANDITVHRDDTLIAVTVRAPIPLIGLIGIPDGIEVTAHAPVE